MKTILVMAALLAWMLAAPRTVMADIEDNQITIENYGTTEAKGYKKKRRTLGFSHGRRDTRGSNAGGVIIGCAIGSSCNNNRISIRNTGNVYSGNGGTVAGVTLSD